jgi:pantoate--beta-alanine ligase
VIPVLARTRLGLAAARRPLSSPVVLVPTMGALHEGHRALLRRARELAHPGGSVVVSVFVNPLQFGAGEDLDRYPRTLDADLAVCAAEGAALVFAPGPGQVYPREQLITVDPGPVGRVLEGASRPGHFAGVLTVVLKLFQLTRPDIAVFGEKDAQQLALVRRMVLDFDLPVTIESVPVVRDPDGLAVSSRNAYLSAAERASALALSRALRAGVAAREAGPEAVLAAAQRVLDEAARADPPLIPDYLALVEPDTFTPVKPGYSGEARLLVAGRAGATRLIDNMPVKLPAAAARAPAGTPGASGLPAGTPGAPAGTPGAPGLPAGTPGAPGPR